MGDSAGDAVELTALPRVTDEVSTLVNRILVAYLVLSLLPAMPFLLAGGSAVAGWWWWVCGGPTALCVGALLLAAVRGTALRRPTVITAIVLAVAAGLTPFASNSGDLLVVLWWLGGPIGVAVALVSDLRICAAWTVGAMGLIAALRWSPWGDGVSGVTAVSLMMQAVMGVLIIGALGRGLVVAAHAADEMGTGVYHRRLAEAVDRAVAVERHRLDRLIHDDVLTSMVAAAHATETGTVPGTAALARETLRRIDAIGDQHPGSGSLSVSALFRLIMETARRVSPAVSVQNRITADLDRYPIPVPIAEVVLAAMREAVRNAVRHSGATSIAVELVVRHEVGGAALELTVTDDGCGFDPDAVAEERLGIRFSINGALRELGYRGDVTSRPGAGTQVVLRADLPAVSAHRPTAVGRVGPVLPERFPAAHLVRLAWIAMAVEVLRLALNPSEVDPLWPHLVAAGLLLAVILLVLRRTGPLVLPAWTAVLAIGLTTTLTGLIVLTLPTYWPESGSWFEFVLQLVFATLVVRRRGRLAVIGVAAYCVLMIGWALGTTTRAQSLLTATFGPVAFLVLAFLVARQLAVIARREVALQADEAEAIEQAARRHVAVVQRGLWLADLRQTARATLVRIAACTVTIPAELRQEALLVEAGLREGLVARSVMSEELADMTEAARRRGVSVTFVDSRQSPVPDAVGQAVVAEVRDALSSRTVSRLVVRIGPDGRRQLASVVSEDEGDLNMTTIDADGARARDDHDG